MKKHVNFIGIFTFLLCLCLGAFGPSITSKAISDTDYIVINVTNSDIQENGVYKAIQGALNTARDNATDSQPYKIIVESGSYVTSKTLRIYSNTYLCLNGVTLIRDSNTSINIFRTGVSDSTNSGVTGYDAYRNITIEGGELDGGGTHNTMLKFAHASNLSLFNITLGNVNNGHIMEVAGIDGLTIEGCAFKDQVLSPNTSIGYEAIQLDILVSAHFSGYRSEDLPMKNVLINNCSFTNCPRGVGSHTAINNLPFDGITITNCTFSNITSVAIQGQNWKNCTISGNTIDNCPRGIAIYSVMTSGKGTYSSSTIAQEGGTTPHASDEYTEPVNQNIVISNNTLTRCGYVKDNFASYQCGGISAIGYNLSRGYNSSDGSGNIADGNYYLNGVTISDNSIETAGYGIRLSDTQTVNICNNTISCSPNSFDTTTKYHGIYVYQGNVDTISENLINNASVQGMFINQSAIGNISDNQINSASTNGIYVYPSSSVGTIKNNTITSSGKYGISIDKSTVDTIQQNTVEKSASNGIHITNGSTFNNIINNTVTNSGHHGISVINSSKGGNISDNDVQGSITKAVNIDSSSSATGTLDDSQIVDSIKLSKKSITVGIGESVTLKKTISPSTAVSDFTWSSSDTNIVTVNSNGKLTAKKAGTATITVVSSNNKTASCKVTVKKAPSSVSLNKTKITLGVGETFDLNSKLPSGCASYSVVYSSNKTSVAKVKSAGGLVTAQKAGTATITAKTFNGKKVTCTVTVKKAPSSVSLNKTKITLGVGETFNLKGKLPSGSASYSTTFSSSKKTVAAVNSSSGLITAKKAGTATIKIKTFNGKTATCKITVKTAPSKVTLTQKSVTIKKGKTYTLSKTLPKNTASNKITWTSSNTSVATIKDGKITAKSKGTATITIKTFNGKTATCKVTVKK